MNRATFLQHETNKIGKINTESLAHPGMMRADDGEFTEKAQITTGTKNFQDSFFYVLIYLI